MTTRRDDWIRQPLLSDRPVAATFRARALLFLAWTVLTLVLAANHVPWRDEVRAFSLMRMADGWLDLFRVVQGEGHPFLWYILLKAGFDLTGARETLPLLGLLVGLSAGALLAFRAPFRLPVLALLLFSMHLGFAYSVVSRNYGISALILFVIALFYERVKNGPWFGLLLLLLCNTNAPAVLLAGAMLLYRMVEVALERPPLRSRKVAMVVVNGLLLLLGTLLCFLAVYPPVNDAAAEVNRVPLTPETALLSLIDAERSFSALGFDMVYQFANLFILLSLALFARSRPAIAAGVVAFLAMKLFFFFLFPAGYRHAALFLMFLVALLWIEADKKGRTGQAVEGERGLLHLAAAWGFVLLLAIQSMIFFKGPVLATARGEPYSEAARLAAILERPEFAGATLMADPDAVAESVVYYSGKPFWLLRQGRLGTITPFSMTGNKEMSLDDILAAARRVHRETGRPVVIALQRDLATAKPGRYDVMYADFTTYTRENMARFRGDTRLIASLRGAYGDEEYDVYVYPR